MYVEGLEESDVQSLAEVNALRIDHADLELPRVCPQSASFLDPGSLIAQKIILEKTISSVPKTTNSRKKSMTDTCLP